MGRGGSGSSGRSSGGSSFSSSRSSGGRMASSGRGGSSTSRGRSSSSIRSGGISSGPGYRSSVGYRSSYSSRPTRSYGYSQPLPRIGCLTQVIVVVIFLIVLFPLLRIMVGGSGASITPSTVSREPLSAGAVITTEYYTDELGWIRSGTQLEKGMRNFFKQTGVQPYLYITDTVNGTTSPSASDMDAYASKLYDELFQDEGHFLLLFHEYNSNSQYSMWYACGAQAKTVMDKEACDILMDYVDKYYYTDKSEDDMFSCAFDDAADRIMAVTKSPLPALIITVCAVLVLFLAFTWWKKAKAQKNLEAEQTERILNSNFETLAGQAGQAVSDPLEEKYRD